MWHSQWTSKRNSASLPFASVDWKRGDSLLPTHSALSSSRSYAKGSKRARNHCNQAAAKALERGKDVVRYCQCAFANAWAPPLADHSSKQWCDMKWLMCVFAVLVVYVDVPYRWWQLPEAIIEMVLVLSLSSSDAAVVAVVAAAAADRHHHSTCVFAAWHVCYWCVFVSADCCQMRLLRISCVYRNSWIDSAYELIQILLL